MRLGETERLELAAAAGKAKDVLASLGNAGEKIGLEGTPEAKKAEDRLEARRADLMEVGGQTEAVLRQG